MPAHLNELGHRLRELASEVREAMAELAGDSLGRAVRDALTRFWRKLPGPAESTRPRPARSAGYDWTEDPTDPWGHNESGWSDRQYRPPMPPPTERQDAEKVPDTAHLFALALHAGGWWLQRYGSWLGAVGLGCTIGGVALIGGRAAIAGFNLLEAVSELYTLNNLLSRGGKALTDG
jgi:hypothetical protein